MTDNEESSIVLGAYSRMFVEYLKESPWAAAAEHRLIVFHVEQLCAQLDNGGLEKAAMSGAYLNAIKELDKRRPGTKKPLEDDDPAQTSIFDHMDD